MIAALVLTEVIEQGGATVARITLNRPEKKNACTPEMQRTLLEAVLAYSASGNADVSPAAHGSARPIGALLIDGHGPAFCAGFDLSLCKDNSDALADLLTTLSTTVQALKRCPFPVVIAAHGVAIAGGCAMLAGADFVITNAGAKLGYPVVKLGISPAVNVPTLRLAVGDGRARERGLNPSLITGADALQIGLAHECLDDAAHVRDRALALALELARKPGPAMRATRALLAEIESRWLTPLDNPPAAALAASMSLVGGDEERERLAAFWKS